MIDNIKNAIYQNLNELFIGASVDEMTGDFPAYKEKLKTIANIAEILGVNTEVVSIAINIRAVD